MGFDAVADPIEGGLGEGGEREEETEEAGNLFRGP